MAQQSRDTLKRYFVTGAYPTEQQFADLIDSLRHHTDTIGMSLVNGLIDALNGKADKSFADQLAVILRKIDEGELGGMTPDEKEAFERLRDMFKVDKDNLLLLIRPDGDGGDTYVCPITKRLMPTAPQLSSTTTLESTGTSVTTTITNRASGSTIYYTTDGSDPTMSNTAQAGTTVSLAVSQSAASTNYTVRAAAKLNGLWSDVVTGSFTTKRKVATPSISANGNKYTSASTKRTVTITCGTAGAVIKYTTDNSDPATSATAQTYTAAFSVAATTTVRAIATHSVFVTSAEATPQTIVVGAPKTYYGMSVEPSLSASDVSALTGGSSLEADGISASRKYTVTLSTAGYVWICQPNTLNPSNLFHDASDVIPAGFNAAVTVGGWNCYRSTEQWVAGTNSIYLKP